LEEQAFVGEGAVEHVVQAAAPATLDDVTTGVPTQPQVTVGAARVDAAVLGVATVARNGVALRGKSPRLRAVEVPTDPVGVVQVVALPGIEQHVLARRVGGELQRLRPDGPARHHQQLARAGSLDALNGRRRLTVGLGVALGPADQGAYRNVLSDTGEREKRATFAILARAAVGADVAANAAILGVVEDVGLAAVFLFVAVAIVEAGRAGTAALAGLARRLDVIGGASDAASAAVLDVHARIRLAAVFALVAIAVGEIGGARAVALPVGAGGGNVTVRASQTASATALHVAGRVDFAAVFQLVAVAILKTCRAGAVAAIVTRALCHVIARADQTATGAVVRIGRDVRLAAGFAITISQVGRAEARAQHALAVGLSGAVDAHG